MFLAVGCAHAASYTQWVRGVSETSGWTDYNKSPASGDGDDKLCWAAAASNVINWWQNRYQTPAAAPKGEAIWSTFKSSVSEDVVGAAQCGFQWWLTGIYDIYSTDSETPEKYDYRYAYTGINPGDPVAIENETINQESGFEGYYRDLEGSIPHTPEYFPWNETLSQFFSKEVGYAVTSSTNEAERPITSMSALSLSVRDCISHGAGATLGLSPRTGGIGHAVTLWGAQFGDENVLEGVWLTDSDDNEDRMFYAELTTKALTFNMSTTDENGSEIKWEETRNYLVLETEDGWLNDMRIDEFSFYNTSVSDTWGLVLVPEPATATLSLLALAGLVARRRR